MDWNDERIAALILLWREGLSASQVARRLGGVSRSAVIGKVHRLGIASREKPPRPRRVAERPSPRPRALHRPARQVPPRAPVAPAQPLFEAAPTATILTLTKSGCRWPIGDPAAADFGFCGRLKLCDSAYCAGHASIARRRRRPARRWAVAPASGLGLAVS